MKPHRPLLTALAFLAVAPIAAQADILRGNNLPTMGGTIAPTLGNACNAPGQSGLANGGVQVVCAGGVWSKVVVSAPHNVTKDQSCAGFGRGSFGYDATGKLYVCK